MKSILVVVFAVAISACGPMNKKNDSKTDASKNNIGFTTSSSLKNNFYIYKELKDTEKEALGDINYLFRIVNSVTLSSLSGASSVKMIYWMPEMPEMGKMEEKMTKNADGDYEVEVFYSMPGLWEIQIYINDGDRSDEFKFSIEL